MISSLIRNVPLKVVSLLLALLVAYSVHSSGNASVVSLFVPIEVKNVPEDRIVVKSPKKGVQVTLKGPSFLIGPLASSPPALRARLPDDPADRVSVSFTASDIPLPHSVEVVNIDPPRMEFALESLERRDVKVEVPRIGHLAQGLVLDGIEVTPKTVSARGPRSEVRQLRVVESEPINLSTVTGSVESVVNLRAEGSSLTFEPRSVVARIMVQPVPSQKEFSAVSVEVRAPRGLGVFEISPANVSVTVSGPPDVLAGLSSEDIIPFVRMQEMIEKGPVSLKVQVDVPATIKVVQVSPTIVALEPTGSALSQPIGTKDLKRGKK